jgi:hypothetical protein
VGAASPTVYDNHMLEDEMLGVYRQLRREDRLAMRVVTSPVLRR